MFVLDEDALLRLLMYLAIPGLLAMRQTCKRINILTRNTQLWIYIYCRDVPVSHKAFHKPLSAMSGSEVEMLVLHPLRLANTLYHLNSLGMNTPEALSTPLHQASSVTWVKLLQGQLLIVASSNAHQSTLSLWSVPALFQGGKQAAELTKCYLPGPVYRGVLDLQGNNAVFALELRSRVPSIQVVCLRYTSQSAPTFYRKAYLEGAAVLRTLRGRLIGFGLYDELSVPCVWNWEDVSTSPLYKGGCVAMAFHNSLAAVVEPYRLSLYTLPSDDAPPLVIDTEIMYFDDRVTSAAIEFLIECSPYTESVTTHIVVCSSFGLHVYAIPLETVGGQYRPVHRWSTPDVSTERYPVILSPSFGHRCHSVLYIADSERTEDAYSLVTTWIPTGCDSSDGNTNGATSAMLAGTDMPALYLAATYDFDDRLGLLVVGNGFGELALYSFGDVPPYTLAGCLQRNELICGERDEELPRDFVFCSLALPFPYSGARYPPMDALKELLESWRANVSVEPPGWSSDWFAASASDTGDDTYWLEMYHPFNFIPYLGRFPYEVEHTFNYFGTPTPLIYQDHRINVRALFRAGGLLFIVVEEPEDAFMVLPPGTTIEAAATVLETKAFPYPNVSKCLGGYYIQAEALMKWYTELKTSKRNRWAELKKRGGEVDPDWLVATVENRCVFPTGRR